ncbi:MAG: hypothetical protein H6573_31675 [Lewinellaceae bacterium]|nr:hypothetical protein [Phaeodactylibacter sp.]MCB0613297.1 hypothetical protein [Phaeodactylibacter sp.]MCB9352017.1 hypothetical protein [Lewinellaceae bacterium]
MAKTKIIGQMGLIQLGGVFLLLVIFPLVSWYYLRTGLDYRLQAIQELKDFGKIPAFTLANYNDSLITSERFAEGLVVGYFFSAPHESLFAGKLAKLHEQFDERDDIFFLAFAADTTMATRNRMQQFAAANGLVDEEQNFFLEGMPTEVERLAKACQMPFEEQGMSLTDNSLLFFADSLMVRGFYDIREEENLKRLVKHITLNIPPKKDKELLFEREVEK